MYRNVQIAVVAVGLACGGENADETPCVEVQPSKGNTSQCQAFCAPESMVLQVNELWNQHPGSSFLTRWYDVEQASGIVSFQDASASDNELSTELLRSKFHVVSAVLRFPQDENFHAWGDIDDVAELDALSWENDRLHLEASYVETYVELDLCPGVSDVGWECGCGYDTNIGVKLTIDAPLDVP